MNHKIKCSICGRRFRIIKAQVYQATEAKGIAKYLTEGTKTFDVMDCPSCGCQKTLQKRMGKRKEESEDGDSAGEKCPGGGGSQ